MNGKTIHTGRNAHKTGLLQNQHSSLDEYKSDEVFMGIGGKQVRKRCQAVVAAVMIMGAVVAWKMNGGQPWISHTVAQAAAGEDVSSPQVSMSKESGCYADEFLLEIKGEGAAKIYYTTDGSNPVESDTRIEYTEAVPVKDKSKDANVLAAVDPVLFDSAYLESDDDAVVNICNAPKDSEVDKATVIKAVGVDADGVYGRVATNTYFIGRMAEHIQGIQESCKASGVPLSIMSISMDYDDLFDYEKGIYVKGKIFDEAAKNYGVWDLLGVARKLEANYNQRGSAWERRVHIDYLESDGENTSCRLQQDCGIRIQGNYSRSDLQKGFRLYARQEYGQKKFEYAFFGEDAKDDTGAVLRRFKKLTLRNGGNASFLAKYNDAFWQSLVRDVDCETQHSRVCAVYLNGEYWGIYILQEDYDDNYFEEKHGVNKSTVVVYKGDAERYTSGYKLDEGLLPAGETDEGYYFRELMQFFQTHSDLKKTEDYEAFEKLVDVDSVRDFFAVQVWINNKWDWPGKNWSMWKTNVADASNPYADGRWRLCLYDLDFGGWGGKSEAATNTMKEDGYKSYGLLDMDADHKNPTVLCFSYLMSNEKFRDTYKPLYPQFFQRFFGEDAKWRMEAALRGAGSYQAMADFIAARPSNIQKIINWVNDFYKTHTIYNSALATGQNPAKPEEVKGKITAKKGKKYITVKTAKKAKVTVKLSKKIILSGRKKVKKLVVPGKKNKKGVIKVKLSSKLKKGMEIAVIVEKNGSRETEKLTIY